MNYTAVRASAVTGDVIMAQGFSPVSRLIRAFTGEKVSHIGMLLWLGDGLFISEFVEFKGYNLLPASLWVEDLLSKGDHLFYGKAPASVREASSDVARKAFKWRRARYGYLTLPKIWWSQWSQSQLTVDRVVCSTYIDDMWKPNFEFPKTSDPGDYFDYAEDINRVEL